MVNVSWNDAVAFCKWLSKKEGKTYRLPTEAEWEYACRAGTTTRYYSGDDPETLAKVGNVADATFKANFPDWKYTIKANDGYVFTAPVGKFKPNAFGLYDMHGNAWQWCADRYGADYYAASALDDPTGPDSGPCRVLRGGSWFNGPIYARSADRSGAPRTSGATTQASALPGLSNAMQFWPCYRLRRDASPYRKEQISRKAAKAQRSFLCAFAALRETSTAARSLRRPPASACTLHVSPLRAE